LATLWGEPVTNKFSPNQKSQQGRLSAFYSNNGIIDVIIMISDSLTPEKIVNITKIK